MCGDECRATYRQCCDFQFSHDKKNILIVLSVLKSTVTIYATYIDTSQNLTWLMRNARLFLDICV
jgi:hypothetical protein